jgi:hypothetical protein
MGWNAVVKRVAIALRADPSCPRSLSDTSVEDLAQSAVRSIREQRLTVLFPFNEDDDDEPW